MKHIQDVDPQKPRAAAAKVWHIWKSLHKQRPNESGENFGLRLFSMFESKWKEIDNRTCHYYKESKQQRGLRMFDFFVSDITDRMPIKRR